MQSPSPLPVGDPWFWLGAGVLLVLGGLLGAWWARRGATPTPPVDADALSLALLRHLQSPLQQLGAAGRADAQWLHRELGERQGQQAGALREELGRALARFQQGLATQSAEQARAQAERLQLLMQANDQALRRTQDQLVQGLSDLQRTVDERLSAIRADTERQLEQVRATVDEKLHATLETRLGESFRQVAERLEQVHRGLGEMQHLAQGVGDLKRVLGNVKTRGVLGEVQLGALIEQVMAPSQYALNVATVPGSAERVEFAIRLPGRDPRHGTGSAAPRAGLEDEVVWLPIDAKFPREDHERLQEAQSRGDREAAESAAQALERRVREEARRIAAKYVAPPHTTDFAILFLPTEGLYADVLRRPGLVEALQREHRVTLAGPTTLLALLNSLQMGFRTLALERRSAEVWAVLGAVKTEFGRFGEVLAKTRRKLDEASRSIDAAEVRTRVMSRRLKEVEALPVDDPEALRAPDAAPLLRPADEDAPERAA